MKYNHAAEVAKRGDNYKLSLSMRTIKRFMNEGRENLIEEAMDLPPNSFARWVGMLHATYIMRHNGNFRITLLQTIEDLAHQLVLEQLLMVEPPPIHLMEVPKATVYLSEFSNSASDASESEPEANGSEATTPQ